MKHAHVTVENYDVQGRAILSGVDFLVKEGDRIALVGGNGVGKTTLLRIMVGEITDYTGQVENLTGMTFGYLSQVHFDDGGKSVREELLDAFPGVREMRQKVDAMEASLATDPELFDADAYAHALEELKAKGGYETLSRIDRVATGLSITELLDRNITEVSGGQRTKIALAKTLLIQPDFLLLDEPTNFIDLAGMQWLEGYLNDRWKGGFLVVSHDREFLDKTCTKTWDLLPARPLDPYDGNYTDYVRQKVARRANLEGDFERQQDFIAKEQALINRFRAGSRASAMQSRLKALDKIERLELPPLAAPPKFKFEMAAASHEKVVELRECFIGRTEPLFYVKDAELKKKDRIGIMGENGAGKSTLLKTILGKIPVLDGDLKLGKGVEVGYYSQLHEELDKTKTVRQNMWDHGFTLPDMRLSGLLGHYGFKHVHLDVEVGKLSGGQQSKLLFAIIGQKRANLLVLDEPTNHLDYEAREALEEALEEYPGTILFISHDRYFINKVANKLWVVRDGNLFVSYGNYDDYVFKIIKGLSFDTEIFQEAQELDLALVEKLGEREARRMRDKFLRRRK